MLRTALRLPRVALLLIEFQRVWRQKTRQVREQRSYLERSAGGPRLSLSQIQSAGGAVTG